MRKGGKSATLGLNPRSRLTNTALLRWLCIIMPLGQFAPQAIGHGKLRPAISRGLSWVVRSTLVAFRKAGQRLRMRTAAQAAVWSWIALSIGWMAVVAWVALMEMDESVPLAAYAMTALMPPGCLLAFGAALSWTARASQGNANSFR